MFRGLPIKAATLVLIAGSAPLHALPDYLLSEQPVEPKLDEQPSSFDGFHLEEELGTRPLGILLTPDETVGLLFGYLPDSDPFIRDSIAIFRPRFYHRYSRRPSGRKQEATALGGALELQTGWWMDSLQLGFGAYTSQKLYGPPDRGGTGLLTPGQGGITVLGEAWAKFRHDKWLAEIGRSSIDVPYINQHDIRMIPQRFEMASLVFKPRENLSLGLAHFSRVKPRDSDDFISMSQAAGALDKPARGVTSAGLAWTCHDQVEFTVLNHYGWDTFNTTYAELNWACPTSGPVQAWNFGLQFSDQRSVGEEWIGSFNTQQFGAKASAEWQWLTATLATTLTSSKAGIRHPWGGSPSYLSSMIADFDRAGEWAGRLIFQSDLGSLVPGLATVASIGYGDTSDGLTPGQQEELDLTVDYRPPFAENFWFRVRQAWRTLEGETTTDFRVIINYEQSF